MTTVAKSKQTKTFVVAGFARVKGVLKMKIANDLNRAKALEKAGMTDIQLIQLDTPMTEWQIATLLMTLPEFQFQEAQDAIDVVLARYAPKATAEPKVEEPQSDMLNDIIEQANTDAKKTSKRAKKEVEPA